MGEMRNAAVVLEVGPPRRDAAVVSSCALARPDATCLESFAISAGAPFLLPFQFDGCACCAATSCEVEVDERTRTLRIATRRCADTCDCDTCNTPSGLCEVPALATAGEWRVVANDTPAFSIGVVDTFGPPAPPGCATYAEVDDCGATPDFTASPVRGAICLSAGPDPRLTLNITQTCSSCGLVDSSCEVLVEPRLTDDLPAGGDIRLFAREYGTSCDVDCPDVCILRTRACDLPPLVNGDFYRVIMDGEVAYSFVAGAPVAPCPTP
jgi:hypothetical protein